MGCGCKQQPTTQSTPKIIQMNSSEVEFMNEPKYTIEEVTQIETWLTSTNKTKEQTDFVHKFISEHYGELIQGYCDIPCQHRIRRRVEDMKEKLMKWKKDQ